MNQMKNPEKVVSNEEVDRIGKFNYRLGVSS